MSAQKRRYYAYTIMLVWGTYLECIEIVDYAQACFFSDLIQTVSRLYLARRSAIVTQGIHPRYLPFRKCSRSCSACAQPRPKDTASLATSFTSPYSAPPQLQ